jgi:glycosylphosphatidylinositol transamidase (GPIT) subunit GPI8
MFKNINNSTWLDDDSRSLKYENFNLKSEVTRLKKNNDLLQQQKKTLETRLNKSESELKSINVAQQRSVSIPQEFEELLTKVENIETKHKIENLLSCVICVVCNSSLKSVLYTECRHLTACIKCAERLENICPLCRTISKKVTIFH